jgi:hypothetical protein
VASFEVIDQVIITRGLSVFVLLSCVPCRFFPFRAQRVPVLLSARAELQRIKSQKAAENGTAGGEKSEHLILSMLFNPKI